MPLCYVLLNLNKLEVVKITILKQVLQIPLKRLQSHSKIYRAWHSGSINIVTVAVFS